MKVLIYSAKDFEIPFLEKANNDSHQLKYISERLTAETAHLALGFDVVSIFSADDGSSKVLERLKSFGIRHIALRSTGYDNVNLSMAKKLGIKVAYAPGYSPKSIAEHAVALLLAMNRKLVLADRQVSKYNFSLSNLVGFDIHNKTIGVLGTGNIGKAIVQIMHGFGCTIVANDLVEDSTLQQEYNVTYLNIEELCAQSDIIFLNVPLTTKTHHFIDKEVIKMMKNNIILINIARGGVVNTEDILSALDFGHIAGYASDVYEHESGVFFYDLSDNKPNDIVLKRLIDHPNVLLTPHQAFATKEALTSIAETTFYNINCWQEDKLCKHDLTAELVR
ncbi:2-hydroxyacid dehydrogenase [Aquimarina algicola]|uniref:2-hydroxyacid dehydrogenase n=1 Tax=Aquimarina algicola TaxID=2589995 RepID=A0A504JFG7_9FLAO|nr:2-hydroxyacid dehydrogenase [Aquimarina algicola]TPN87462.1 2-hydroxyacid dehydrogenase [Aquimarina algicola]